jgi:hypothetical protein
MHQTDIYHLSICSLAGASMVVLKLHDGGCVWEMGKGQPTMAIVCLDRRNKKKKKKKKI